MTPLPALGLYALCTGALLFTSYAISVSFGYHDRAVRALVAAVVASSLTVVYTLGLLLLGMLSPFSLSLVVLGGLLFSVRGPWATSSFPAVVAAVRSDLRQCRTVLGQSLMTRALAVLAGVQIGWAAFLGVLLPPMSWDGLGYHLPPVVAYVQRGQIALVESSVFANTYPNNVELHFLWNVVFLRTDLIVNTTQLWFALVGALSVYVVGRRLDLDTESALLGAAGFVLAPMVLIQSVITYVDLGFAGLLLAAYALLLHYWNDPAPRLLVPLGLAVGLVVGTKFTGGLFALIFGGAVVVRLLLGDQITRVGLLRHMALFGGLGLTVAGYWYARNVLTYGNPLYPFRITVLGTELLNGTLDPDVIVRRTWEKFEPYHGPMDETSVVDRLYLSWYEKYPVYTKGEHLGGYGPFFAVLAVPSAVVYVYDTVVSLNRRRLLAVCLFCVPLLISPGPWLPRYNLYIVGFGGVAVGHVRQSVSAPTRSVLTLAAVTLLVAGVVMASPLNPWVFQGAVSGAVSDSAERHHSMAAREGVAPMDWETYETAVEPGSRVGFVLNDALPYTLYGGDFRVSIEYVGGHESRDRFHREVTSGGFDYLVLARDSMESHWANETDRYTVRHQSDTHILYEVTTGQRDRGDRVQRTLLSNARLSLSEPLPRGRLVAPTG